jgi:hypothetical protein
MRKLDFVPPLLGVGTGLADGAVVEWLTPHFAQAPGVFRLAELLVGALGLGLEWDDDLSYGLITVATNRLAGQVIPAIAQRNAGTLLAADITPARGRGVRVTKPTGARAAGCTSCGDVASPPPVPVVVNRPYPGGDMISQPGLL